jgi:hypothetical protein
MERESISRYWRDFLSGAAACDQPTAVQVPSGLRQALPRATSGRPSI